MWAIFASPDALINSALDYPLWSVTVYPEVTRLDSAMLPGNSGGSSSSEIESDNVYLAEDARTVATSSVGSLH